MLIDCDVHPQLKKSERLTDYMPPHTRDRFPGGRRGSAAYEAPRSDRLDAIPPDGNSAGSDPDLLEAQLLREAGVDVPILLPFVGGHSENPDMSAAIKAATNEWLADTWLSRYNHHGQYRGTISIPLNNVPAAVREVDKWAGHPYLVGLLGNPKVRSPLGNRQYHPLWEVAARHGLPLALHGNSAGMPSPLTPVGYCSYYLEAHAIAEPTIYISHLLSFICEGVFDKFPDFKVVFVEGGFSWVAPVIWRLEKAWGMVRSEFPHIKRSPTEYLYDNVRFTSQPIEEPDGRQDLTRLFDIIDAPRILMFATDYPHWDYDNPARALPRLSEDARRRITYQNAAEVFGIPVN